MRNKVVAGNWKMNKTFTEAEDLVAGIVEQIEEHGKPQNVDIILFPPYVYLELAKDMVYDYPVFLGSQNVSQFDPGAYTGEISAAMLSSMHIDYCLVGHSERRKYFGENNEVLFQKVITALKEDVIPVFCCGEEKGQREDNKYFETVEQQLKETIFKLPVSEFNRLIIAYEPVWAIGTGLTATPEQAQEMHAFIRKLIRQKYGDDTADNLTILYGGSCNSKNARELFSMEDVDGGLIGGASLDALEFFRIIKAAG